MKFFVASKNPVKINAVKHAVALEFPEALVDGFEAPSNVSDQPMSDDETRRGAFNRAHNLRQLLLDQKKIADDEEVLCIGLEGGVFHPEFSEDSQELWSTVWAVALDQSNQAYFSNGARFPLPTFISEMLHAGLEMGPALGKHLKDPDLRSKGGAIGFLTKNFTNRTDEYTSIAKIAVGLWCGREQS